MLLWSRSIFLEFTNSLGILKPLRSPVSYSHIQPTNTCSSCWKNGFPYNVNSTRPRDFSWNVTRWISDKQISSMTCLFRDRHWTWHHFIKYSSSNISSINLTLQWSGSFLSGNPKFHLLFFHQEVFSTYFFQKKILENLYKKNHFNSRTPTLEKPTTWMETKRLASLRLAGSPFWAGTNPQVHQLEAKPWRHRARFTKTLWSPPGIGFQPGKAESWDSKIGCFLRIETSLAWIPR